MTEQAKVPAIRFAGFTDPWEQRKLGDVASSFDYGLNAAATEYDGQNKYLRITDIDDETHEFSKSDLTTPLADLAMSADYLLKEGDLLFARTGASVGKTYLYRQFDGMVYFAGFLIRARIGEGADPEFAYQATLTDAYKKYVAITSQRSGQPGVNAQEYADYQLMLPSKTEQQQIGMTLRSLDDLITLHQRKYDKLVILKKSMLEKMFPKDGESVPEIRFAGFTDPWEQRKLGELALTYSGGTPSAGNSAYYGGEIPFIRSAEIDCDSTELSLTVAGLNNSSAKLVDKGMVLYAMYGATSGEVAISKIKGAINQAILAMDASDMAANRFIAYWLRRQKKSITETFLQGGQGNLSGAIIKELGIPQPSLDEQRQIGSFFSNLDDLITLHQRKLELLQNIKKSLLDKMFV
ncbi:restriction endonuclease subunit S [Bifidobacterium longum]|uniref:restriction endonuclease subunit S n=2 Tax=Bifidobacterium TaxID=1678 RepID=UPI00080B07B3